MLVLLLTLGLSNSQAQTLQITNYSTENILPTNNINTVYQTDDGYLWMGSSDMGLIKVSGTFSTVYNQLSGLRSDDVRVIFQDSKKKVWIGGRTGGVGIIVADSVEYPIENAVLESVAISDISEDSVGNLWVSTLGNGVFIISDNEINHISKDDGLRSDSVWSTWQYQDEFYIFTNKGLHEYNLDENVIVWTSQLSSREYYSAVEAMGSVWITSSDGIVLIDGRPKVINEIDGKQTGAITGISTLNSGQLILITEKLGLILYDGADYISGSQFQGFSSRNIKGIYKDNNLRNWIITEDAGVDLLANQAILKYEENEIGFSAIKTVNTFEEKLFVGDSEGLLKIIPFNFKNFLDVETLFSEPVYDVEVHPNGTLIVLSENSTVYSISDDYQTIEKIEVPLDKESFITDLFISSKETLWIGTNTGLIRFENSNFESLDNLMLIRDYILHISEDHNGNILVSSANSFQTISNAENTTAAVLNDRLEGLQVRYSVTSPSSEYWIGTNNGIYIFNPETEQITHYGQEDGLLSLNIQGIQFYDDSTAFVATSAGVYKVQLRQYLRPEFTHYLLDKTTVGANVHHKSITQLGNTLWFGSNTGLYSYSLATEPLQSGPRIYITDVTVNYVRDGGLRFHDQLNRQAQYGVIQADSDLKNDENNLSFTFQGLDYEAPQNITYSYRLIGYFDERWTPFEANNTISFENLSPGAYKFEVIAKNDREIESINSASFSFKILPKFYDTPWFITLMIIFVSTLVYGIERIRLRWLEGNKLRELVEVRTKSLQENLKEREVLIQEVHHRTKNNLAVISGLLELQKNSIKDENVHHSLVQAQNRIQSIALIHEMLYKNETLSNINFKDYVHDLIRIIQDTYNYQNKKIIVDLDVDETNITIDQGIPCGLILNELVSNSYEHAFKGRDEGLISIAFKDDGDFVNYTIKDNGVGIPRDSVYKSTGSLGMTLVHSLTAQLEGTLLYTNKVGSTFDIRFKKEYY